METFSKNTIEGNIESVITIKTEDNSISPVMLGDTLNKIINQEHVGETITVTSDQLLTINGDTLEDQIINYLNLNDISNYKKHGEIWIEYLDNSVTLTSI